MKKVLAKGSKLLTLTIEGMIARGVIQTDMHKSKVPHETTFLYELLLLTPGVNRMSFQNRNVTPLKNHVVSSMDA